MKFCKSILYDINFEPHAIQPCCNIHNASVPSFPYSGGNIDLKLFLKYITNTLKELQINPNLCKDCEQLKVIADKSNNDIFFEQSAEDVKFHNISFNQHRHFCNCKCTYCNLWQKKEKTPPYSPLIAMLDLARNNLLSNNCFVSWGGGESTILKDFPRTAAWIFEQGYFQSIHTNAMQLSPIILAMLKEGRCSVNISLDAGTKETHAKVKGVSSWNTVLKNIKTYRDNALYPEHFELKYIVFNENNTINDINNFLNICKEFNINQVQISMDFREINNNMVSTKTIESINHLINEGKQNNLSIQPFFIPKKYLWQS